MAENGRSACLIKKVLVHTILSFRSLGGSRHCNLNFDDFLPVQPMKTQPIHQNRPQIEQLRPGIVRGHLPK